MDNTSNINSLINTIIHDSSLNKNEITTLITKLKKIIAIEKRFNSLRKIIKNNETSKRNTKEIQLILEEFNKTKERMKPIQEEIISLVKEENYFLIINFIKKSTK
jgi:hypothetical protein